MRISGASCIPCLFTRPLTYRRPADVAVGKHKELVPIVVICQKREDADAVNMLNHEILHRVKPYDYEGLRDAFRLQRVAREALTKYKRFYAIQWGWETGIWVDYEW